MEIIRKIDYDSFFIEYVCAFNGFLRLSKKEILVLAELLKEEAKLGKENNDLLFETTIRKRIQSKLKISVYNLNNYIAVLKTKGIIKEIDGRKRLNPKIIPVQDKQGKFVLTFNFIPHGKG